MPATARERFHLWQIVELTVVGYARLCNGASRRAPRLVTGYVIGFPRDPEQVRVRRHGKGGKTPVNHYYRFWKPIGQHETTEQIMESLQ